MIPKEAAELRDLAKILREISAAHPAYSMTYTIIQNACDHICAKARIMEVERSKEEDAHGKVESNLAMGNF